MDKYLFTLTDLKDGRIIHHYEANLVDISLQLQWTVSPYWRKQINNNHGHVFDLRDNYRVRIYPV